MTSARRDLVAPGTSGWFHLVNRCVRRAFLCGADSVSGFNYDRRRGWIRDRLLELSNLFAIDLYAFSVMSNQRVEESEFTSIQQRLADANETRTTLTEPVGPLGLHATSMCSPLACLSVGEYVELIEWSGRILREDKHGLIPADVAPVLERLHLDRTHWRSTVTDFNRGFHRAAGHWNRLRERADAIGRHWLQGLRIAHLTYSTT